MKELIAIQSTLNAPKGQYNSFGKYKYRSCEDILAAVKPLLNKFGCILILSDEIKEVGSPYTYVTKDDKKGASSSFNGTRVYVEATATIINPEGEKISVKASAREEVAKAGMDASQITGSASSYARKYALNGLFAIDDTKDADTMDNTQMHQPQMLQAQLPQTPEEVFERYAKASIGQAQTKEDLVACYNSYKGLQSFRPFMDALSERRKALGIKTSRP